MPCLENGGNHVEEISLRELIEILLKRKKILIYHDRMCSDQLVLSFFVLDEQ